MGIPIQRWHHYIKTVPWAHPFQRESAVCHIKVPLLVGSIFILKGALIIFLFQDPLLQLFSLEWTQAMIKILKHPQNNEQQGILDYKSIMHFYPSIRLAKNLCQLTRLKHCSLIKWSHVEDTLFKLIILKKKIYTWILIQTSQTFIH